MEQPATVELFRECDQSGTLAQQHVGLQGRRVRPAKRQLESGDYKAGETLQYRNLRNRRGSPCGLRRQGARATRRICTSAIDAAYSTSGADRRAPLYKKDRFVGGFVQGRADRLHPPPCTDEAAAHLRGLRRALPHRQADQAPRRGGQRLRSGKGVHRRGAVLPVRPARRPDRRLRPRLRHEPGAGAAVGAGGMAAAGVPGCVSKRGRATLTFVHYSFSIVTQFHSNPRRFIGEAFAVNLIGGRASRARKRFWAEAALAGGMAAAVLWLRTAPAQQLPPAPRVLERGGPVFIQRGLDVRNNRLDRMVATSGPACLPDTPLQTRPCIIETDLLSFLRALAPDQDNARPR